jgi:creatinine amidohydrolase
MEKMLVLFLLIGSVLPALGQVAQMRARLLSSLTNIEVEQYLKRNDIIFIPVGTVEAHGGLPLDCEYIGPLAPSLKMLKQSINL